MTSSDLLDVVIVGGGPAGLSAALNLGRARKRVALLDAGTPRNARAHGIHGFVTRDGTPPAEFRRIAREQLAKYPNVEIHDAWVESVSRDGEVFSVVAETRNLEARRLLLAVGMIDELPDTPGYRELWGRSIFQCPFCHGWELIEDPRGGRTALGVLATHPMMIEFAFMLSGWSRDLVVFLGEGIPITDEQRARLAAARITLEERPIHALEAEGGELARVVLEGGERVRRQALFARPVQRQVALVSSLGLALDEMGFVKVDEHRKTSVAGISAAGDLTTMRQGAVIAAAEGAMAGIMLVHELTADGLQQESLARATPPA